MEETIIYRDRDPRFNGKISTLAAETEDALFEEFYKKNNQLRYCNGSYYEFQKPEKQKEYEEWRKNLSHSRSFELYYGNGVVD
jgi:hypothetical protein